jgi:hypothetical protein
MRAWKRGKQGWHKNQAPASDDGIDEACQAGCQGDKQHFHAAIVPLPMRQEKRHRRGGALSGASHGDAIIMNQSVRLLEPSPEQRAALLE